MAVQNIQLAGLYRHAKVVEMEGGVLETTLPERVEFDETDDVMVHVVADGERLTDLCVVYYFSEFGDACVDIWEVLAQFQPIPILDPFVPLEPGREILLPSPGFVRSIAFGDSLASMPEV